MDGRGNNLKKFSKKRTKRKTTTYSKLPNKYNQKKDKGEFHS